MDNVLLAITVLAVVALILWVVFKDTMNKFQCLPWGDHGKYRLYWITRDNGVLGTPVVSQGFMHLLVYPWVTGHGVQFRYKTYTFQVGIGKTQGLEADEGVLHQLGGRPMDTPVDEIKVWDGDADEVKANADVQEEA